MLSDIPVVLVVNRIVIIVVTFRLDMCRREFVSDDCNRGTAGKLTTKCDLQLLLYFTERNMKAKFWIDSVTPYQKKVSEISPSLSLADIQSPFIHFSCISHLLTHVEPNTYSYSLWVCSLVRMREHV